MLFLFSFTCTHLQFQGSRTNSPPRSFEVRIKLSAVHVGIEADTALSSCPLPGAYVWDRRVILLDENVGAFSTHCPPPPRIQHSSCVRHCRCQFPSANKTAVTVSSHRCVIQPLTPSLPPTDAAAPGVSVFILSFPFIKHIPALL